MSPAERASRRHDLLLASDVLRRQIDANLTSLQPAIEPALHGLAIGLWLRRHPRASAPWAAALAVAGVALGGSSVGRFALRHRRWLRRAWIVMRLWKFLRR